MRASDSNFLFAPPGALDDAQISKLEDAGVIVVVSERWSDLKIVRAAPMLPTGDFIAAAGKAISVSEYAQRAPAMVKLNRSIDSARDQQGLLLAQQIGNFRVCFLFPGLHAVCPSR